MREQGYLLDSAQVPVCGLQVKLRDNSDCRW